VLIVNIVKPMGYGQDKQIIGKITKVDPAPLDRTCYHKGGAKEDEGKDYIPGKYAIK